MSRRANTAVIGGFVLGALALTVAALLIFGSGKFFKDTSSYVLYFDGSVKGLNIGAPVNFKGVRIGSVTDIDLLFDANDLSFKIMVLIETAPDTVTEVRGEDETNRVLEAYKSKDLIEALIGKGLRAQLGMQSLVTGQLYVNLDFYPNTPARILGLQTKYAELPTIPSSLEQISKTVERLPLEEIADKFVASLEGIERFINSPASREILDSLNTAVKDTQGLVRNINGRVDPVAVSLEQTLKEARKFLADLDGQVGPLVKDLRDTVKDTKALVKNMDARITSVASGVDGTLKSTQTALKQAESALTAVEGAIGSDSALRYELSVALKELSNAARSMHLLADYLERHPEALIRGKNQ